jgi:hypothetical protein
MAPPAWAQSLSHSIWSAPIPQFREEGEEDWWYEDWRIPDFPMKPTYHKLKSF